MILNLTQHPATGAVTKTAVFRHIGFAECIL